ncbi:MAG: DUF445 family protein [Candidatus Brocadiaceae bacterium]|nr:DUF445 family protein [Candidatus Brocadiaceae bacterium]
MNYLFPFIAALIGWFTNYVAIRMLFHPKEKINLGFFEIQGIFPKRHKAFAEKLGKVVAQELISTQDIKEKMNNIDGEVKTLIQHHIHTVLDEKLKEAYPAVVMYVYNYLIRQFKDVMLKEVETLLPLVVTAYTQNMEKSLDIETTIANRITSFSSDKLEELLRTIMKKEFRFVEIVGGVLGFFIGWIHMLLGKW